MALGYQPTLLVGAVLLALPAAWITKVHMDWKRNPDAKKRMLIAHVVFWSSMLTGFKLLHAALFTLPNRKVLLPAGFFSLLKQLGQSATRGPAAATLAIIVAGCGGFAGSLIAGFEGGFRLAKKLIPKTSKVEAFETPKPVTPQKLFQTSMTPATALPFAEMQSRSLYSSAMQRPNGTVIPIKSPNIPLRYTRYTWNSSY
jgi:hypothetical protein